ncbi:MAG TPA: hypothetical protein PKY56_00075 [Candidatus Kapabacteria bacterium]|nr:hypothetical protein [Candidatus Kapabacteria bacterium]
MEKITINVGEQILQISTDLFSDGDVDADKLLRIDYQNLIAEIATFPVILNRFGLLLAKMNNKVNMAELDLRIYKAKTRDEAREYCNDKGMKGTLDEIDSYMRKQPVYKAKYIRLNKLKEEQEIINSIYWSAKSKADNLQKLSLTIQPGDIDLSQLQKSFNGIIIKSREVLIKNK